jgi:hypothetical protein
MTKGGDLLKELTKITNGLTVPQIRRGLERIYEVFEEILIDSPNFPEQLCAIIIYLVNHKIASTKILSMIPHSILEVLK